jgi:hypothetical protein
MSQRPGNRPAGPTAVAVTVAVVGLAGFLLGLGLGVLIHCGC